MNESVLIGRTERFLDQIKKKKVTMDDIQDCAEFMELYGYFRGNLDALQDFRDKMETKGYMAPYRSIIKYGRHSTGEMKAEDMYDISRHTQYFRMNAAAKKNILDRVKSSMASHRIVLGHLEEFATLGCESCQRRYRGHEIALLTGSVHESGENGPVNGSDDNIPVVESGVNASVRVSDEDVAASDSGENATLRDSGENKTVLNSGEDTSAIDSVGNPLGIDSGEKAGICECGGSDFSLLVNQEGVYRLEIIPFLPLSGDYMVKMSELSPKSREAFRSMVRILKQEKRGIVKTLSLVVKVLEDGRWVRKRVNIDADEQSDYEREIRDKYGSNARIEFMQFHRKKPSIINDKHVQTALSLGYVKHAENQT
jgi:Zn-finger domain-containing protein